MKIYCFVFLLSLVGGMFILIDTQNSISSLGQSLNAHAVVADRALQ